MGNMLTNAYKEYMSAGAKKKPGLHTAGQSSSLDIESVHVFPDTEVTYLNEGAMNVSSTLDTDDLDIPERLTLARSDRENQGLWEAEYSYGGEADLHLHYDNCNKNPGHKDFIPVDKFSIEDLPEGYRDPRIVEYIRAESDLTVRVTVRNVSDKRPKTVPGSDKPYPCYGARGRNRMIVGTGRVDKVVIYRDDQGETCLCKDCRNSSTPETHFAVIDIATANHVVFDDLEAEHATCHLFFDSGGTPDTCSGVVTLTGMGSTYRHIETDRYYMNHFTHDLHLGHRLQETCTRKDNIMFELCKTLPPITNYKRSLNVAEKQPLIFILSHPHGCRKHISVGHWSTVSLSKTGGLTFEYTAATCPGSSGATVVMPHHLSPESRNFDLRFAPGTHTGASEERPGANYFTTTHFSVMRFSQSNLQAAEPDYEPLMWLWFEGRSLRVSRHSQEKVFDSLRGAGRFHPML